MRINWGTGIVIAFVLFISFILYFVLQMTFSSEYDGEMVQEDYYQEEYVFQQAIDAQMNGRALEQNIEIDKAEGAFVVNFPQKFDYKNISGTIYMYRPSDKKLDFKIPIQLESSSYTIPSEQLAKGKWEMTINWKHDETDYRYKKVVYN